MSRVWQEFYCNKCSIYIDVKLNMAINHVVEIVCPSCEHKHSRCIKDGVIHEDGRFASDVKEQIRPVASCAHKEPRTVAMRFGSGGRRDGVPARERREFLDESWYEKFGGRE